MINAERKARLLTLDQIKAKAGLAKGLKAGQICVYFLLSADKDVDLERTKS